MSLGANCVWVKDSLRCDASAVPSALSAIKHGHPALLIDEMGASGPLPGQQMSSSTRPRARMLSAMADSSTTLLSQRRGFIVWFVAIGLITLGAYLSRIEFLGNEWLSRAGCLIVVLGIWSGLGSIVEERILVARLRGRRRNAIVRARAALAEKDTDPTEIEHKIDEIESAFDKQGADLAQKLKMSLGVLEFSILITGTLLWGFGDVIIEHLFF